MHKFVSAVKPCDYADQLHDVQAKIQKLKAELKILDEQQKSLVTYLVKYSKGASFSYNAADGYQKVVTISEHERQILDQEKVRKLLKNKTPYMQSTWSTAKIDWVYN